jgi:hypothetical protein
MSYSLNKLASKQTKRVVYDLENDSCGTHNLFDKDLNKISSYRYDEWYDVHGLYEMINMTQEEHDDIWKRIKGKL